MVELIITGIISGFITSLGMGGGSVLILILTSFLNVEQQTAQAANLIFFIPTAIVAIIIHFKNKNIDKIVGRKLIFPCAVGAGIGAYFTKLINSKSLRKYFGIFLLVIGILELITTIKNMKKRKENK